MNIKTKTKKDNFSDLFGKFKINKTPQELKDESREGWEKLSNN